MKPLDSTRLCLSCSTPHFCCILSGRVFLALQRSPLVWFPLCAYCICLAVSSCVHGQDFHGSVFYTTILHHVLRNNEALANKLETVLKICYPLPNIIIVLMIVLTGSGPDMFWTIVDISLVVPVFFNVIALIVLSGKYKELLKDYRARYLNEGVVNPDFKVFYEDKVNK